MDANKYYVSSTGATEPQQGAGGAANIQGKGADGADATASGNPVVVAGWSGSVSKRLRTDSNGCLAIGTSSSGGSTIYRAISAASNNAASVKGGGGRVYGWNIVNTVASIRYVKFYNKATAPNPASDTPVNTILVPASSNATLFIGDVGQAFSTGIGIAAVTNVADNDNTAIGAGDLIIQVWYA